MRDAYADGPFDNCHPLLGHALRAVPEERRPPPPYHLGGPAPKLDALAYLRLSLRMCRYAEAQVEGSIREVLRLHGDAIAAALEAAPDQLATHRRHLDTLGTAPRPKGFEAIGSIAASAAGNAIYKKPDRSAVSLKGVLNRLLEALEPTAVIEWTDRAIQLVEAQGLLEAYGYRGPVDAVLYRGDRGNGVMGHLVAHAGGEAYVAVTKQKSRFVLYEGDLESAMAMLPDVHLALAAAQRSREAVE